MSALKHLLGGATALALLVAPVSFGVMTSAIGVTAAQAATANVSINVFFSPLASHGVWVKSSKYHYVFCPKVDANWRPYTHGRWVYMKNYGWYFASDEPFAWAVYHYGRWYADQKLGWCWVPGNAWAGAWVSWRRSNDYIGWAPLPPTRDGFSVDVDVSKDEPPKHDWVFVQPRQFLQPKLDVTIIIGDKQPDAFEKTKFVGPVVVQNNIVVNNVIEVNFIQQVTNTKVVVVDPKPVDQPDQAQADVSGNTIAVFAPQIPPPKQDEKPDQSVDEAQAQTELGNANGASSSEQPSGASSIEASSSASSGLSSSAPSSDMSSSSPAPSSEMSSVSSSAEASASSAPASDISSSASSSAAAPVTTSSEEQPSSAVSSSEQPSSSREKAVSSSEEPASSSAPPPSSREKASSSDEAPVSSSAEPAPSSQEQASSKEEQPSSAAPQACEDGYVLVKGKCVPADTSSSAAQ